MNTCNPTIAGLAPVFLGTIAGLAIAGAVLFVWWLTRLCRQTAAEADQAHSSGMWDFLGVEDIPVTPRVWIAPGVNIMDREPAPPGVPPGAIVHVETGQTAPEAPPAYSMRVIADRDPVTHDWFIRDRCAGERCPQCCSGSVVPLNPRWANVMPENRFCVSCQHAWTA